MSENESDIVTEPRQKLLGVLEEIEKKPGDNSTSTPRHRHTFKDVGHRAAVRNAAQARSDVNPWKPVDKLPRKPDNQRVRGWKQRDNT